MNPISQIALAHELSEAPSLSAYLDNLRSTSIKSLVPRKFTVTNVNYQHPGLGDGNGHDPNAKADVELAKRIGERLHLHYPGHPWYVEVEHAQGIAKVSIPSLMGWTSYYVIHLSRLAVDPNMTEVTKAGGEILERYRIPRNKYDFFAFAEACNKVDYADWRKSVVPT